MEAPLPPLDLMTRVGTPRGADPVSFYLDEGHRVRERIVSLLPPEWSLEGRRVLDFGCGSGRVLRHFLELAPETELWGCDIDGDSVEWLRAHLSPAVRAFRNESVPPLRVEAGKFDLVWATSVFTHIANWSEWLAELHRVLAPGGLLIASWLGEGVFEAMLGQPYVEDATGMTVLRHWLGADAWVFHSEWWLREHWGRAFELLEVIRPPRDAEGRPEVTHSYALLRRREVEVTVAGLETVRPGEPREVAGLQTSVRLLREQTDQLLRGELGRSSSSSLGARAAGHFIAEKLRRTPLRTPLRRARGRILSWLG